MNVKNKNKKQLRGGKKFHQALEHVGADRSQERWVDLIRQFDGCYKPLIGRGAMLVLPGHKCAHTSDEFRPVHRELPRWRSRPAMVFLTVGAEKMLLSVAMSFADDGKLVYVNGNGEQPCSFDFYQMPRKGGRGEVLDSFVQHKLFAVGCNLLQELLNTVERPAGQLELPQLRILTDHVKIDEAKLEALAAEVQPELRDAYVDRLREEAGVISLGQLFGNAEVMFDEDIASAFAENRAYEDYSSLLGAEHLNPARKLLLAANPARAVLSAAGLPDDWATTADEKLVDRLLSEMRQRIPLPERALDSDLLDALENPAAPVKFSIPLCAMPAGAIVAAMRRAFPKGAAVQHAVSDEDLLAAARAPYAPLIVRGYSKTQVFELGSIKLPSYAAGSFFARPRPTGGVELA